MKQGLSVCGAAVALYACSTLTPPTPPSIDFAAFTTEGKATKTEETDWGTYELYDPAQDPDVQAVYKYAYDLKQSRNGGSIETEMMPYADFLETVRNIQSNDLARAGCERLWVRRCALDFIKVNDLKTCPNLDFGSSELNSCEADNIEFIIGAETDAAPGQFGVCPARHKDVSEIGERYKDKHIRFTREGSMEVYFDRSCLASSDLEILVTK